MKKVTLLVAAVVSFGLLILIAQYFAPIRTYSSDRVEILGESISDHGVELSFRPLAESMYYCPGANFTLNGSTIHFELVRAKVGDQSPVDVPAVSEEGGRLSVTFPFPGASWQKGDIVELVDSDGKHYGPCG
ncbi:MAG: hypothetical protein GY930_07265 [bacterium]|nr:hypothetical protein [bacterium]